MRARPRLESRASPSNFVTSKPAAASSSHRMSAEITPALAAAMEESALVLFDGTFWSDDELSTLKPGARTSREMGHLPIRHGSLPVLRALARTAPCFSAYQQYQSHPRGRARASARRPWRPAWRSARTARNSRYESRALGPRNLHRAAPRGRRARVSRQAPVSRRDERRPPRAGSRARLDRQSLSLPAQHPAEGRRHPLQLPVARSAPALAAPHRRSRWHDRRRGRDRGLAAAGRSRGPAARGVARRAKACCPAVRFAVDAYVHLARTRAVADRRGLVAHRALRARSDGATARRVRDSTTPGSSRGVSTTSAAG